MKDIRAAYPDKVFQSDILENGNRLSVTCDEATLYIRPDEDAVAEAKKVFG